MKFRKITTKVLLAVALMGGVAVTSNIIDQAQGNNIVHAASYRTWEYRTIRSGVGFIRQRRSVIKGYYKNVGWVYSSVGPWQTY